MLTLDEIPKVATILKKDIDVEKFDVISEVCKQQFSTLGLPSLYEELHIAFKFFSYLLFMLGLVSSAVFTSFIHIHMDEMACHALMVSLF